MSEIQDRLFEKKDLSQQQAFKIFSQLIRGELDSVTMTALLVGLKLKGESAVEVAGAAQALRAQAGYFDKPDYETADSCGTGGSGKHTANISTLVAFVAAAKGLKMVKHGNRSISSKCGSADVLEQLNVNIGMSAKVARKCLDGVGVTFLFAPLYHPGVKNVMPVRNALKTRTIFNLLGPLINPARPEHQLMGVYAPEYCYPAAESLRLSGCKAAMVVHSQGFDEITLADTTQVAELRDGKISEYTLTPSDFGLTPMALNALVGGTPASNAKQFEQLLKGQAESGITDTVAANAGALFYITGSSPTLKQGVMDAKMIIECATALEKLHSLAELSQRGEN